MNYPIVLRKSLVQYHLRLGYRDGELSVENDEEIVISKIKEGFPKPSFHKNSPVVHLCNRGILGLGCLIHPSIFNPVYRLFNSRFSLF